MSVTLRRVPPARAIALAAVTVLCFALQQHLVDLAAALQHGTDVHGNGGRILGPSFYQALPYPVVDEVFAPPQSIHLMLLVLGALETAVLYALYHALRGRATSIAERACLVVAAVAMVLIALRAHAVTSFDLYAYVGYAKLAGVHAAYAPPPVRFPGEFGAINDAWGTPLVASYYGPLWIAIGHAVAGGAASVRDGIFAMRLVELIPVAAIAVTLALRRTGIAVVALFALNPAVHMLFIANGHNDLMGAALVLIATTVAGALPLLAAILVALAGLVKLPFVACAALVFAGRGRLPQRAAYAALAVALCVAVSLWFAGIEYVHDLLFRLHQVNEHASLINQLTGKALRGALLLVAAVALGAAFLRGIMWRTASWPFMAVSTVVWPWYLAWAFPYAALERRALVQYLVLLPLAAALLEAAFPHLGLGQAAMVAMLSAAVYAIARRRAVAIPPTGNRNVR